MRISLHTTTTNPRERKYPYLEALQSFCDVADEVIVVDGISDDGSVKEMMALNPKITVIALQWPWDYTQAEFPKHLNAGLEVCTGDWAIKCDIDYIFHEKDIVDLQVRLRAWQNRVSVLTLEKINVLNRFRAYRKASVPFIINKKLIGDKIKYGRQDDQELDDWSYPVLVEGIDAEGVPHGKSLPSGMVERTGVDVWNYDYFFRTEDETKKLFARNAKAWRSSVNDSWGKDDESSWMVFSHMMKNRLRMTNFIPLEIISHPKYIRERIKNMGEEEFGHSNWGWE